MDATNRAMWGLGPIELGAWCAIPSALVAEALGTAGFDWVCVDCQHGLIGYEAMVAMLQALSGSATPGIVRVSENARGEIGRALDAGAAGVIVPMVNSADDARAAVTAARYPPLGQRSWGPTRAAFRGDRKSLPPPGRLLVMLETGPAFERLDEILAVPGIDGVFVGPSDLAVSLGLEPGAVTHPEVISRCSAAVAACRARDLIPGIGSHSLDVARTFAGLGFAMLSLGRDLSALREGLAERLAVMRREGTGA